MKVALDLAECASEFSAQSAQGHKYSVGKPENRPSYVETACPAVHFHEIMRFGTGTDCEHEMRIWTASAFP
jgi:hypothetical protein